MEKKITKRKLLEGLRNIIAGIVVGVSNVIPGVSGGTMAVVMNVYDELIDAISIRRFKKHLFFLITLVIGMAVGIKLFSGAIEFLFTNYNMQTNFTFLGLILGSLPMLYKRATAVKFRWTSLIPFAIAFAAMVLLDLFGSGAVDRGLAAEMSIGKFLLLMAAGMVSAFAMIMPGVSGSMIMVLLGTYSTIIGAVSSLDLLILLPFGIGAVIGAVACLKLIKFLLDRFYQGTYFAILGLILGSLGALWPGFTFDMQGLISVVLMLVAAAAAYLFARSDMKMEEKAEKDGETSEEK